MSVKTGNRDSPICILAVVTTEIAKELERIVSHTTWQLQCVNSFWAANAVLAELPVSVVLCQQRLMDGTWLDIIHATREMHTRPETIVLVEPANFEALLGELLNCGVYDVLPIPLKPRDLYAAIPSAWRHCRRRVAGGITGKQKESPSLSQNEPYLYGNGRFS